MKEKEKSKSGIIDIFNKIIFENPEHINLIMRDFTCAICDHKLNKPLMCEICQSYFCNKCTTCYKKLKSESECPSGNDCSPFILKEATLMDLFRQSLDKLMISCSNGCGGVVSLLDYLTFYINKKGKKLKLEDEQFRFECLNCLNNEKNFDCEIKAFIKYKSEMNIRTPKTLDQSKNLFRNHNSISSVNVGGSKKQIRDDFEFGLELRQEKDWSIAEELELQKHLSDRKNMQKADENDSSHEYQDLQVKIDHSFEKDCPVKEFNHLEEDRIHNNTTPKSQKQKTHIKETLSVSTTSPVTCLIYIQENGIIATGHKDKSILIWNLFFLDKENQEAEHTDEPQKKEISCIKSYSFSGHKGAINNLSSTIINNQSVLISCSEDFTVKLWDLKNRKLMATLYGHQNFVTSIIPLNLKDDKVAVVSGSSDKTVRIWNPLNRAVTATLLGHLKSVTCLLEFEINNKNMIISGSEDKQIIIWNPENTKNVGTLNGHEDIITCLAKSYVHGMDVLVSGSDDKTIRLWSPSKKVLLFTLEAHIDFIHCICSFKKEEKTYILTGGEDKLLKLWDAETKSLVNTFEGHIKQIWSVDTTTVKHECDEGEILIISGSSDNTFKFWKV